MSGPWEFYPSLYREFEKWVQRDGPSQWEKAQILKWVGACENGQDPLEGSVDGPEPEEHTYIVPDTGARIGFVIAPFRWVIVTFIRTAPPDT